MKLQELNLDEMRTVNGGGLFGNNDSSNSGGLLGSLGIGNLLSFQSHTKDGDEESTTSFSLGNDITTNLGGIFDAMKS